jgi:hypothetical protein
MGGAKVGQLTSRDLRVRIGRCASIAGPTVVAVWSLTGVAGIAAQPTTTAPRAPIVSSGHRPFVPRLGDWEGAVEGYPASFELVYQPGNLAFHLPPYGFADMATIMPASCPPTPNRYVESVIGEHELTPLGPGGSFPLASDGITGGLRGSESASLSRKFDTGREGSARGCRGTLTWVMHPASRRTVQDGSWTLRFGDGESEPFTVLAGGRLASGIAFPSVLAHCGGPFGNVNLFVSPSGAAAVREQAGQFAMSLRFTGADAASGQLRASKRCGAFHLAMTASLAKAAGGS